MKNVDHQKVHSNVFISVIVTKSKTIDEIETNDKKKKTTTNTTKKDGKVETQTTAGGDFQGDVLGVLIGIDDDALSRALFEGESAGIGGAGLDHLGSVVDQVDAGVEDVAGGADAGHVGEGVAPHKVVQLVGPDGDGQSEGRSDAEIEPHVGLSFLEGVEVLFTFDEVELHGAGKDGGQRHRGAFVEVPAFVDELVGAHVERRTVGLLDVRLGRLFRCLHHLQSRQRGVG